MFEIIQITKRNFRKQLRSTEILLENPNCVSILPRSGTENFKDLAKAWPEI